MSSYISVVFSLLICFTLKNHLNLVGFLTAALCFVCFCVKASRWMTRSNAQAQFYCAASADTLATTQSLLTDGTESSQGSQAKATMCGAISNQDLMTENIHYKTQNKTRSTVPPWSDMEWMRARHTSCVASELLCSRMYQFNTFAFLLHPDLSKPQSLTSLFHHCLITRSKERIIPTSSSEMLPSLIVCCTGADNEEHMLGGGSC